LLTGSDERSARRHPSPVGRRGGLGGQLGPDAVVGVRRDGSEQMGYAFHAGSAQPGLSYAKGSCGVLCQASKRASAVRGTTDQLMRAWSIGARVGATRGGTGSAGHRSTGHFRAIPVAMRVHVPTLPRFQRGDPRHEIGVDNQDRCRTGRTLLPRRLAPASLSQPLRVGPPPGAWPSYVGRRARPRTVGA
jgi:hypothetical protein